VLMAGSDDCLVPGKCWHLQVGSTPMEWEFLASLGPTVVLMTNSEEHLGVPNPISSLGRLGTIEEAMRPLISVSTSDGAPATRASNQCPA
jgi:hypothetical protein